MEGVEMGSEARAGQVDWAGAVVGGMVAAEAAMVVTPVGAMAVEMAVE